MAIIVHDHGAPEPVVTVVEDPIHALAIVEPAPAPPPPPPTVKEVAAVVEFAAVVDNKKKSP